MPRQKTKPRNDNPEWTDADFARGERPEKVLAADVVAQFKKHRGRPKSATLKEAISVRLDPDVLAAYRKLGTGWQSRLNADLRKARKLKVS